MGLWGQIHDEYLDKVGSSALLAIRQTRFSVTLSALTGNREALDMANYTDNEMMALAAGRFIKDGDIVFAGTGVSMLAATAAKRIYAPKAVIFFETGGIDPSLEEIPMAVADLRVMSGTCLNSGLIEAFSIVGHRNSTQSLSWVQLRSISLGT